MKKLICLTLISTCFNHIVVQAEAFKLTSTGDVSFYSFFTNDGSNYGVGFAGDFSVTGSQILVDGSEFGATFNIDTPEKLNAYLFYKSLFGTVKAGNMSVDAHDVIIPTITDHANSDSTHTAFSNVKKQSFGGIVTPEFTPVITYTSPKFTPANLNLGLGIGLDSFDIAFASSFNAGNALVKVGAGYAGNYSNLSDGNLSVGTNILIDAFELGGKITTSRANATSAEIGGNVVNGPIKFGIKYQVKNVNALNKGVASAGIEYNKDDLSFGADIKLDKSTVINGNALSAKVGAKYKIGPFSLGTNGEYNIDDSTFAVDSGVDYELNSKVTVGAGVLYDHDETLAGAAGVKIKF